MRSVFRDVEDVRHWQGLHAIARENGFAIWLCLRLPAHLASEGRSARAERLTTALCGAMNKEVAMRLQDRAEAHPDRVIRDA